MSQAETKPELPDDRQRHTRSSVYVDVKVTFGSRTTVATILNISLSGAKLRSGVRMAPGKHVTIKVNDDISLTGEVVWESRDDFGICFTGDPEKNLDAVVHIITEEAPLRENRQYARRSVFFSGILMLPNGALRCRVRNISLSGVLVSLSAPASIPDRAKLSVSRFGEFVVDTVWQSDLDVGFRFCSSRDEIEKCFGDLLKADPFETFSN